VVASSPERAPSVAPSAWSSCAIWMALRVLVPSSSVLARMSDRPFRARGSWAVPPRTASTKLAFGTPSPSATIHSVMPLASVCLSIFGTGSGLSAP